MAQLNAPAVSYFGSDRGAVHVTNHSNYGSSAGLRSCRHSKLLRRTLNTGWYVRGYY
jgi:hypothetical protein